VAAPPVPTAGIVGVLYASYPMDACSPLVNVSKTREPAFLLIERGSCTFEVKVRHAQEAGFEAVIVYNDQNGHELVTSTSAFHSLCHWNQSSIPKNNLLIGITPRSNYQKPLFYSILFEHFKSRLFYTIFPSVRNQVSVVLFEPSDTNFIDHIVKCIIQMSPNLYHRNHETQFGHWFLYGRSKI